MFDSRLDKRATGGTEEDNPKFKVTMSQCALDSVVFVERKGTFEDDVYSYANLSVDITGM